MRLIDADKLDMSVKVDGDRTLSPISQLIAQTIIENAQTIESDEDCIGRQAVLDMVENMTDQFGNKHRVVTEGMISLLPPVTPKPKWIPVSERLPEDLEAVNITWVNHEPEPYYHDIKDRNFTATGIHYRGKWYWYSTTCADYLGEYGSNEVDEVDSAIEIVAWMPLPEPYKATDSEKE